MVGRLEFLQKFYNERALEMKRHWIMDESMESAYLLALEREQYRLEDISRGVSLEDTSLSMQFPDKQVASMDRRTNLTASGSGGPAMSAYTRNSDKMLSTETEWQQQGSRMAGSGGPAMSAYTRNSDKMLSTETEWQQQGSRMAKVQEARTELVGLYQISDGRQVYLHPQNYRQLLQRYGSVHQLPHWIEGSVLHCYECRTGERSAYVSETNKLQRAAFQTEKESGNRVLPFPAHLPRGCAYIICKLALDQTLAFHPDMTRAIEDHSTNRQFQAQPERPSLPAGVSGSSPGEQGTRRRQAVASKRNIRRSAPPQRQQHAPQHRAHRALSSTARRAVRREGERSLREAFEQERQHIIEAHGGAQVFFRGMVGESSLYTRPIQRQRKTDETLHQDNEAGELADSVERWPALGAELDPQVRTFTERAASAQMPSASYARITQVRGGYFPALQEWYSPSVSKVDTVSPARGNGKREKHPSR
jgi:hypothetical protein